MYAMAEVNYLEAVSEQDIISALLVKSLGERTTCEQKQMLQREKAVPRLNVKTGNRAFQGEWYTKNEWLCGSNRLQKLFC